MRLKFWLYFCSFLAVLQLLPQYVIDMLWELRKEQDEQCAGIGDKWQDCDRLFIKWDGSPMNNNTPCFSFLSKISASAIARLALACASWNI